MCWRFKIFVIRHFEIEVVQAKDIWRNLTATQINCCSRYHLGVSYVKTNTGSIRNSQRQNYTE